MAGAAGIRQSRRFKSLLFLLLFRALVLDSIGRHGHKQPAWRAGSGLLTLFYGSKPGYMALSY
jgi:hypothetical protein